MGYKPLKSNAQASVCGWVKKAAGVPWGEGGFVEKVVSHTVGKILGHLTDEELMQIGAGGRPPRLTNAWLFDVWENGIPVGDYSCGLPHTFGLL